MLKTDWIKNLATSQYDGQKWHIEKLDASSMQQRAIDQLIEAFTDASAIFNGHNQLPISVYPLKETKYKACHGVFLVRGKVQVRLAAAEAGECSKIVGSVVVAEGYQLKERIFTELNPAEDPWGAIAWRSTSGSSWTTEQLVRNVLIHLLEHTAG